MNAAVVFAERFRSDLQAQTRRLVTEDRRDWAVRLIDEIELASKLLRRAPQAGAVDPQPRGRSIRRLVLHKLPFVVWYRWEERPAKVIVLRLFHVRQRRQGCRVDGVVRCRVPAGKEAVKVRLPCEEPSGAT